MCKCSIHEVDDQRQWDDDESLDGKEGLNMEQLPFFSSNFSSPYETI